MFAGAVLTEDCASSVAMAIKLIYLSLRQIEAKWKRPPKEWHVEKAQLTIPFGERFTLEN